MSDSKPMSPQMQLQYDWEYLFLRTSRPAYYALVSDSICIRFLKIHPNGGENFVAICGTFTEEGLPVVLFSTGMSLYQCLKKLGHLLRNKDYQDDKYADEDVFELGEKLVNGGHLSRFWEKVSSK